MSWGRTRSSVLRWDRWGGTDSRALSSSVDRWAHPGVLCKSSDLASVQGLRAGTGQARGGGGHREARR